MIDDKMWIVLWIQWDIYLWMCIGQEEVMVFFGQGFDVVVEIFGFDVVGYLVCYGF